LEAGVNPIFLVRGIKKALNAVIEYLEEVRIFPRTNEFLLSVA
jgi:chaperonin GroEL (HSP60 family)